MRVLGTRDKKNPLSACPQIIPSSDDRAGVVERGGEKGYLLAKDAYSGNEGSVLPFTSS